MLGRLLLLLALLTPCAFAAPAAAAQFAGPASQIDAPLVKTPPPINGDITAPQWQHAAKVTLTRNLRDLSAPDQPTTVYALTDGTYLYVAFEAKQSQTIQASQHTNDVGQGTDDYVAVYLWPGGVNGFSYSFSANPIGTHYQSSSENTAYAPSWSSSGHLIAGGYAVTMRIPLKAMRGAGKAPWRVQFERFVQATKDDYIWPYDAAEPYAGNPLAAGFLTGLGAHVAKRPQARFGLYGLGAIASRSAGGSTSRMGLDASIPITESASFVAAIHPDYSNVELDQQSIAPTAFQRYYNEVRPFFTQLANFYNDFTCVGCPGIQELYTPSIPTPRDAYAIEGKQGGLSFSGFDAVGIGRNDTAQALTYATNDQKTDLSVQRVSVDGYDVCPGIAGASAMDCFGVPDVHNVNTLYGVRHDSLQGLFEYLNFGTNSGTFVSDPGKAQRLDFGMGMYDKNSFFGGSIREIGAQYYPIDGYIQQTDLLGYDLNANKTWYLNKDSFITRFLAYLNLDRYHNSAGQLDLTDNQAAIGFDFRPRMHFRIQTGSDYTRLPDGNFVPINQNGINLSYNYNTAVPTQISYFTGRYGPARLDSWTRSTSIKVGTRGSITLEADNNIQWMDFGAPRNMLWLERVGYAYQNGKDSSIAIGVRRIIGAYPLLELPAGPPSARVRYQPCSTKYNPCFNDWNLSAAFYKRFPHDELYVVYGDASRLITVPQLIIKLIHYFGAEKGT